MSDEPEKNLEEVVRADGRYPLEAFAFLHDGLARAVRQVYGEGADEPDAEQPGPQPTHHVSGQQLCQALRDEAVERWGLLARTVLARWNIHASIDFGHMVYLLVDSGHMRKTESDTIEDFRDVYDFDAVFGPESVFEEGS
jgi:uncharacterized repeat protein (TIGR04138 family)